MSRWGRRDHGGDDCDRMYGLFECHYCGNKWESAHVHYTPGDIVSGQKCRRCKRKGILYHVEPLKCGDCGYPCDECTCCRGCRLPEDQCTCCQACNRRQKDRWSCRTCREDGRYRRRYCRNQSQFCECDAHSREEDYKSPYRQRVARVRRQMSQLLAENFTNVYIKNLPEDISDIDLRRMFSQCGKVVSAKVVVNEQGKSKGFAFVNYKNNECASRACEELNDKEIMGKRIYVGRAQKKAERQAELKEKHTTMEQMHQGVNLYVKNLGNNIDDERLYKEFSKFGTITSATVMREFGRSKGFGFVCFSSPKEAAKAMEMNGRILDSKPLYVGLAQRKEDRKAYLTSLYMQKQIC